MRIYKHFDLACKTKHKIFIFNLDGTGRFIGIEERNRVHCYKVEVDLGGGDWLRRTVEEVLRLGKEGNFKRFYKGSNYQLVVDSNKNKADCFLRVLKIQNGVTTKVIIPTEYAFKGWEKFGECLQSFFSKYNSQRDGVNKTVSRNVI